MLEFDGFKKAGIFAVADGKEVHGELTLRGGDTTLDLYSSENFNTRDSKDIVGVFFDRSKVSLVSCVTMSGQGFWGKGKEHYSFSRVFPHLAVFGNQHIRSTDRKIRALEFTIDDAHVLFNDVEAFGWVTNAKPHMERIIEAGDAGKAATIGEFPDIFYFSGKREILTTDTVLGKVSATHCVSYTSPSSKGIRVENAPSLNIEFQAAKTIEEALSGVMALLRFLEIIAGRPQNLSKLVLVLETEEGSTPEILNVYWCMPPRRDATNESGSPHHYDLPIQAANRPDEFAGVLARWLGRHDQWQSARERFATAAAFQGSYGIDRLVGAANMFDILPSSEYPKVEMLPPELKEARDFSRKAFQDLPATPERDSILGALGRIGKPSLKRKVRHRARAIADAQGHRFPELDLVIDQAIDCRNYYVHGTSTKIDYSKYFDQVMFFTDTLEFVFAASDLLDSGWDIADWATKGSTLSHPFGRYIVNYPTQLVELKKCLQHR